MLVHFMQSKSCYWELTDCFNIYCESMAQQASSFLCQMPLLKDSAHQPGYPETLEYSWGTVTILSLYKEMTSYPLSHFSSLIY